MGVLMSFGAGARFTKVGLGRKGRLIVDGLWLVRGVGCGSFTGWVGAWGQFIVDICGILPPNSIKSPE